MALIICEECGRKISSKAKTCPHCGCPVPEQSNHVYENTADKTPNDSQHTNRFEDNIDKNASSKKKNRARNNSVFKIALSVLLVVVLMMLFLIFGGKDNPKQETIQKALEEDEIISKYISNIQNIPEEGDDQELLIAEYQFTFDDSRNTIDDGSGYTGGRFRMFSNSKLVDVDIELLKYIEQRSNAKVLELDMGALGSQLISKPTHKYIIGNALLEISPGISDKDAEAYYTCIKNIIGEKKYKQKNVPSDSEVESYLAKSKAIMNDLIDKAAEDSLKEMRAYVQKTITEDLDEFEKTLSDELKTKIDNDFQYMNANAFIDIVEPLQKRYDALLLEKEKNDEKLFEESKDVIRSIDYRLDKLMNSLDVQLYDELVSEISELKNNKYYADSIPGWTKELNSIQDRITEKKEKESYSVAPSYDDLMRYSDTYKNEKIKITVYITKVDADGWFIDGTIWGTYQGQRIIVVDDREVKEPKILGGDTIVIYGNGNGLTKITTYAEGTGLFGSNFGADVVSEVNVPVVSVKYCDFR